jgi:type I restriction enzyme S subunit
VLSFHDLASLGTDSVVPGLNHNLAYMSKQVLPPNALLEIFDSITHLFFQRIYETDNETHTLAAMRDTLLPKLLPGETRLKGTQLVTEEAL